MKKQFLYIANRFRNTKLATLSLVLVLVMGASSCKKLTDVGPISNEDASKYYKDYKEVNVALAGCYNGMQAPLVTEWMLTELRSDNAKQRSTGSTTNTNQELNVLNLYTVSPQHQQVYNYWLNVYSNIRNINYVLRSLGITYDGNGHLVYGEPTANVTNAQKAELAGQALFLRAYHYFNMVRLFGGVFLIAEPVTPTQVKGINRSSVQDCYNFIISDLQAASEQAGASKYAQIPVNTLGKANSWSAKALLAKVYLTMPSPRPDLALPLLDDVITNSGYGLESSFSRVFSVNNEMNQEILFAVRYKAGLVGLGNFMANSFAPASSGDAVINGDGSGFNYPTSNINAAFSTPVTGFKDSRKDATIAVYANSTTPLYVNKFMSKVVIKDDAENDFPVIRFSDVLLMKAEALGYDGAAGISVGLINRIRERAGAGNYTTGTFGSAFYKYPATGTPALTNATTFKAALLNERRLELAFENQRFFDMVRFGEAVDIMKNYYSAEYSTHYGKYKPQIALADLQANVTTQKLLLPIPQREIDTNTQIEIAQNSGY
ncbi:RagB/SusD family nutrient uptake outer membrane protein [Pedobacter arcticus]|uniref:RagB/SusD family nutrient uptake outer membrane protein n=1 Tax=Pedobacter arcticus TaxID=752140 RepID=UPI0012B5095D|nr:RagB/SusD family nutrient uptake outer membrane protein [Pedobacter arcticus]